MSKDWPVNKRPREVAKQALSRHAAVLIRAHSQPLCCVAGVTTGSPATDFAVRRQPGVGQDRWPQ